MNRFPAAVALALALAATPAPAAPDRRGEDVVKVGADPFAYRGESASFHIDPKYHVRNESGRPGGGLCVIASGLCNGMAQGVPALQDGKASALWLTAKKRPGGYSPDKLARLLAEVMPEEKYASFVGKDPAILDRLSREGYPIACTMNTGALYNYMPIHHMVSVEHYRTGGRAFVVDNNRPGFVSVMPASEYARRWVDGGTGWAWVWLRKHPAAARAAGVVAAALVFAAGLLLVAAARRRAASEDGPDAGALVGV